MANQTLALFKADYCRFISLHAPDTGFKVCLNVRGNMIEVQIISVRLLARAFMSRMSMCLVVDPLGRTITSMSLPVAEPLSVCSVSFDFSRIADNLVMSNSDALAT